MLSDSILGKIDRVWGQSACFKLCSAVLSFFSGAWSGSFLRKVLYRLAGLGRTDNGARKSGGTNVQVAGASVAAAKDAVSHAAGAYDSSAFARV
ncbi:MAG: hypothetical protein II185_00710, partial [Firmicutes bacterium]|nr:hypothetical protein [Bacillota bacterium]